MNARPSEIGRSRHSTSVTARPTSVTAKPTNARSTERSTPGRSAGPSHRTGTVRLGELGRRCGGEVAAPVRVIEAPSGLGMAPSDSWVPVKVDKNG
jgi:hypothetical protein